VAPITCSSVLYHCLVPHPSMSRGPVVIPQLSSFRQRNYPPHFHTHHVFSLVITDKYDSHSHSTGSADRFYVLVWKLYLPLEKKCQVQHALRAICLLQQVYQQRNSTFENISRQQAVLYNFASLTILPKAPLNSRAINTKDHMSRSKDVYKPPHYSLWPMNFNLLLLHRTTKKPLCYLNV
jgi:hypothetical protein